MTPNQKTKILNLCQSIVKGEIDLIVGCRALVSMRNDLGLDDDLDFLPFIGVVSETDDWPEPGVRQSFNASYLEKIDKETEAYVAVVYPSIIGSCNKLISKYGR